MNKSEEKKKCPECGSEMVYVEDDPEFGNLGWICNDEECGRV